MKTPSRTPARRPRSLPPLPAVYNIEPLEARQLLTNMLVFTAPPATTNAGSIINSATGVQVTVETSAGVPMTSNTDSITIAIGKNPTGATLDGTVTALTVLDCNPIEFGLK